MSDDVQRKAVLQLVAAAKEAYETAKTADRNRKSLSGDNFYANSFHDKVIGLEVLEGKVLRACEGAQLHEGQVATLRSSLATIKALNASVTQRTNCLKQLSLFCQSVLIPAIENMTANPVPLTEQVLPMSVVRDTRPYIEKVVIQANGCYEHQWFDACSVMIRRLTETLIIEMYEHLGRADHIKNAEGNYHMLNKLIDLTLADTQITLGRETKRGLPLVKSLGDRSAHNRYFIAQKRDVDNVTADLRVIADELLHKAGLK